MLPLSSYKKFRYYHHFQCTSENLTVLCCIRHSLAFLMQLAPQTLRHMAPPMNDFDIDIVCIGEQELCYRPGS